MKRFQQLAFTSVLEDSFRSHERRLLRYMAENVEKYKVYGRMITPALNDPIAVYSRIAFAILSANVPFKDSVKALNVAIEQRGKLGKFDLAPYRMVPAKADYCNELWEKLTAIGYPLAYWLKRTEEPWSDYRYRLQRTFKGLGIAKASFAVCLLYPLEADLACVDTWIQKVFLGHTGFQQLGERAYEQVEAKIRTYGVKFGVSTFLAQWMIWDHARGEENDHDIFPGSHKGR